MPEPRDYEELHAHLQSPRTTRVWPVRRVRLQVAVMSGICGNLEALTAVLEFLRERGYGPERIVNLGDTVAPVAGPDPQACLELAATFRVCLRSRNDDRVLGLGDIKSALNPAAARSTAWAQSQLKPGLFASHGARQLWKQAREFPYRQAIADFDFCYGTPRDPGWELLRHRDDGHGIRTALDEVEWVMFHGAGRVPGVYTHPEGFRSAVDLGHEYRLPETGPCIIDPGGVGHRRDGDPRACVVTLDGEENIVRWHRVDYDIDATTAKIQANPHIDNRQAERLRMGY